MNRLKRVLRKILGRFPSPLPTTKSDMHIFADSILEIYDLPDMPSYRHAVCTMIMHLDPLVTWKAKHYFAASIRKAMANQIAYDIIQDIKEAEKSDKTEKSVESIQ